MAIDIVIVTNLSHIYIVNLAIQSLKKFADVNTVYLVTAKSNIKYYKCLLEKDVRLIEEDTLIPTITKKQLEKLEVYNFPNRAGWYYQQLLKYSIAFVDDVAEDYLVWDADTILLREMEFIDSNDRYMFSISSEYHRSYFDNYRRLLGEEAEREFSFISQHMIFNKKILKEMLCKIETRFADNENWAWKIMKNIKGTDGSLFSEYETYGHYIKKYYPEKCAFRKLEWLREGTELASFLPSKKNLSALAAKYYFASFELRSQKIKTKIMIKIYKKIFPIFLLIKTRIWKIVKAI